MKKSADFCGVSSEKFFGIFVVAALAGSTQCLEWPGILVNDVNVEKTILEFFTRSFDPIDAPVGHYCRKDSAVYRKGLVDYEPWALQMYDASTKIPFGLLTGNTKQLGNYDECLKVDSTHGFAGKACTAKVQFSISETVENDESPDYEPKAHDMRDLLIQVSKASGLTNWTSGLSVPYEWLWCVPSSCGPRDVAETIEIGLDPLKRSPYVEFSVLIGNDSCHTLESDRRHLDTLDWLYISLLILFGSLVTISTLYDLAKRRDPEKPDSKDTRHKIFVAFSAYTNWKSLMRVERIPETIDCLHGLRFLSICWIIYGHTHYLKIVGVGLDLIEVAKMHERWDRLFLLNANIVTDTFLLLSGFLLAYTLLRHREKDLSRGLSIWSLYLRRYIRLTPAYAIVIGFYATLFYKIGSGPHWNTWIGSNRDYCQKNWWTNLLYVNNYVDVPNMCMSQSWYLSVDMQLLWISPIFLYFMLGDGKRKQLIFFALLGTGFLAAMLAPLLVTYVNELTGTMLYYRSQADLANVYLQVYTRAYMRAAPYLVGIGLAYLLRKVKPEEAYLPKSIILVGWTLCITVILTVVFGLRDMYFPGHPYDSVAAAFYAGLHRPAFALAVGWIIVASAFRCAGPVGGLLSWNFWVPLGKLTYSAYLTHYIVLLYYTGSVRTPEDLTTLAVVQSFLGNLVLTLALSIILSLTFEMPFVHLMNVWTPTGSPYRPSIVDKPMISGFEPCDSILEMYRTIEQDETPSTISRTYDNLLSHFEKIGANSDLPQPQQDELPRRNSRRQSTLAQNFPEQNSPTERDRSHEIGAAIQSTLSRRKSDQFDRHYDIVRLRDAR